MPTDSGEYTGLPRDIYAGAPKTGDEYDLTLLKIWYLLAAGGGFISGTTGTGGGGAAGVSQGGIYAMPDVSGDPVELPNKPAITNGVRITLDNGSTVQWFIGVSGNSYSDSPTGQTITYTATSSNQEFDIPTSGTDAVFIQAASGISQYRFIQR